MPLALTSLAERAWLGFDTVIDVRSPSEFAEDHLPGAINLPVLDDEERARVGTIYKQVSPFQARKIGAAIVARNAARHLDGPLAAKGGAWRPLVYCWRGGQRSGSFATILSQVGWRVETLAGGYKSWRALVVGQVQEAAIRSPVVVLDGNTGSAKTEILRLLAMRDVQAIDLEGLANHRGSLFGHCPEGQPSQKAFEGRLALALAQLDPARPVVVEAESSRIGDLLVPKKLWAAMQEAPRMRIEAPVAERAEYLVRAYRDMVIDTDRLGATIDLLRPLHPRERIEDWHELVRSGQFRALAEGLVMHHYDPRYAQHRARSSSAGDLVLVAGRLDDAALSGLADRVACAVQGMADASPRS